VVHRKYGRSRQRIHRGMARNGPRLAKFERIAMDDEQRRVARDLLKARGEPVRGVGGPNTPRRAVEGLPQAKRPGFLRRLFNRKTGG
jgi:hypothetical protein